MRDWIEATGLYSYPDFVVVRGEARFQVGELDALLFPTVIAEILSPSAEAYDRGGKFGHYRRIPSLREVERFTRRGDDWLLTELNGPNQLLRLDSIGCEVALVRIFKKVEFGKEAGGMHPDPDDG